MTTSLVQVRTTEIGVARRCYGVGYRTFRRVVEPRVCLLDYEDVEASIVSINKHRITVYRRFDQDGWSSNFEQVTRYARLRHVPQRGGQAC